MFEERKHAGETKTGSLISNVCGRAVGWVGAHTACGATTKDGDTFPFDFPYYCQSAARHGTFEQVGLIYLSFPIHINVYMYVMVIMIPLFQCQTFTRLPAKAGSRSLFPDSFKFYFE